MSSHINVLINCKTPQEKTEYKKLIKNFLHSSNYLRQSKVKYFEL